MWAIYHASSWLSIHWRPLCMVCTTRSLDIPEFSFSYSLIQVASLVRAVSWNRNGWHDSDVDPDTHSHYRSNRDKYLQELEHCRTSDPPWSPSQWPLIVNWFRIQKAGHWHTACGHPRGSLWFSSGSNLCPLEYLSSILYARLHRRYFFQGLVFKRIGHNHVHGLRRTGAVHESSRYVSYMITQGVLNCATCSSTGLQTDLASDARVLISYGHRLAISALPPSLVGPPRAINALEFRRDSSGPHSRLGQRS